MSVAVHSDQSVHLLQLLVTSGALGPDTPENRRAISLSIGELEHDDAGTIGIRQLAGVIRLHSPDVERTVEIVNAFAKEYRAPWCFALGDIIRSAS